MTEIQETDTISRAELNEYLKTPLYTKLHQTLKEKYRLLAFLMIEEAIKRRYGDRDPLPRAEVREIVQACIEMAAQQAQELNEFMGGLGFED